jgi:multicomponent Na+:H+ antiporter subunit A
VYLSVVFVTVLVVPAAWVVASDVGELNLYGYDQWIQVLLSIAVVAAAIGVCTARRRFSAALLLGSVGYGIMGLFVTANASDLALTQVLVETVTIVAFVLVLRKLPAHYSPEGGRIRFLIRLAVSVLAAMATTLLIVASSAGREQQQLPAVSQSYIELSKTQANSDNVVNAIITDFRGLDTVLELSVLVVAAVGVASLVGLRTSRRSHTAVPPSGVNDEVDA